MAVTDDQVSCSGNEILIWRKSDEKKLNRESHNDTEFSSMSGGHWELMDQTCPLEFPLVF